MHLASSELWRPDLQRCRPVGFECVLAGSGRAPGNPAGRATTSVGMVSGFLFVSPNRSTLLSV